MGKRIAHFKKKLRFKMEEEKKYIEMPGLLVAGIAFVPWIAGFWIFGVNYKPVPKSIGLFLFFCSWYWWLMSLAQIAKILLG